jgi:helicase
MTSNESMKFFAEEGLKFEIESSLEFLMNNKIIKTWSRRFQNY